MGKLRHGFKAEANRWSRDLRTEMNLTPESPISVWNLAKHLHIPIFPLSRFSSQNPSEVGYLLSAGVTSNFSAVTFFDRSRRAIIHNDSHDPKRQASNLAHEIAHAILGHEPHPLADPSGKRSFNLEQEDEANWLGPALLISDEAAIFIAENGLDLNEASNFFAVSREIVQMRLNVSGARKRVA